MSSLCTRVRGTWRIQLRSLLVVDLAILFCTNIRLVTAGTSCFTPWCWCWSGTLPPQSGAEENLDSDGETRIAHEILQCEKRINEEIKQLVCLKYPAKGSAHPPWSL